MNTNKKIENPKILEQARLKPHNTTEMDKTFQIHTKHPRNMSHTIIKSYKTRFKIVRIKQFKSQSQIEGQTALFGEEKRQKRKAKQSKQ
jgi:hypothetical protein